MARKRKAKAKTDWRTELARREAAINGEPTPAEIAERAAAILPGRVGTYVAVESMRPAGAQGDLLRVDVTLLTSVAFTAAELREALRSGFERPKNRRDC